MEKKLVLEEGKDFNKLDSENPHRKASKEEVKEVFKKEFSNLEIAANALLDIGLFLMPKQMMDKPEELPHITSKWPIMYNYSPRSAPYGSWVIGYVKVED